MEKLLKYLREDYPHLLFTKGSSFHWSPQVQQVFYTHKRPRSDTWSLLHETAHALLSHVTYSLDFELLRMEVDAWEMAKQLAKKYAITIDEDHVQECVDSYRDWLYRRSICPSCDKKSLQEETKPQYRCFNCGTEWQIAPSRFCRPYRHGEQNKESPILFMGDSVGTNLKI